MASSSSPSSSRPLRPTPSEIAAFRRDGVVHLRGVLPTDDVADLRRGLEEAFYRSDTSTAGFRTDMTAAAAAAERDDGAAILRDGDAGGVGRYLTELEAGRWNAALRHFELESALPSVVGRLLGTMELRYFMDHCFLKEAGSAIRTAFHQDAPYFPFEGEQCAVCWCPVDTVAAETGAMGYVRGSHRWPEHSPNTLFSQQATHVNDAPPLPDIEGREAEFDVVYFDAEPGDVIIHHPRTVHGSRGNTSGLGGGAGGGGEGGGGGGGGGAGGGASPGAGAGTALGTVAGAAAAPAAAPAAPAGGTSSPVGTVAGGRRRLAASIRYCGDDVRWKRKRSELPSSVLIKRWHLANADLRSRLGLLWRAGEYAGRRAARLTGLSAGSFPPLREWDYERAASWSYLELEDGDRLDAKDCSRCAFPLVWVDTAAAAAAAAAAVTRRTVSSKL